MAATPRSILIAEDNNCMRTLLKSQLQQLGYESDLAENGTEVFSKVRKKRYALIFMDVDMPKLDGIQATKIIRACQKKTPIVAITANDTVKEQCLAAGMNDFLNKPVSLKQLHAVISRWLDGDER